MPSSNEKKEYNWADAPSAENLNLIEDAVLVLATELRPGDVVRSVGASGKNQYFMLMSFDQKASNKITWLDQNNQFRIEYCSPLFSYNLIYVQEDNVRENHSSEDEGCSKCPKCQVKLEWVYMAEKCPSCWKVYSGS